MKFTIQIKSIVAVLNSLKSVIKPSKLHACLGNVGLICENDSLRVVGMDLEKKKVITIPCKTIAPGSVSLKYSLLLSYLASRGEIECEFATADDFRTTIRCGNKSKNIIAGLSVSEFPPMPEPINGKLITIPAQLLNECLTKSLVQAAIEDSRGYMLSVMFVSRNGLLNIQATNGQRLIIFYTPIEFSKDMQCIIPRESVPAIASLATVSDISLHIGQNVLAASAPLVEFITLLIEQNLQDFETVFPPVSKMQKKIILDREQFLAEIESAETQIDSDVKSVAIICDGNEVAIQGNGANNGLVENKVDARDGSSPIEFAVKPAYLRDALKAFEDSEVTLHFLDEITPFVIRNDSCVSVVYPQRLTKSEQP